MQVGTIVRPFVSLAGLDARRMYRVAHVESPSPFASLHYLVDLSSGAQLPPIENAEVLLEVVRPTMTTKPAAAPLN